MIKVSKSVLVGLAAALLLTACASNQNKVTASAKKAIASDATAHEIEVQHKYAANIKKKRKNKFKSKEKIDLKKFCFKSNRSIHYKAPERCR
jgi:uncharacterized lipoprotein YajG